MKTKWIALSFAIASTLGAAQEDVELTREELAAKLQGVEASDISASPLPGIYEVSVGANVAYVTTDGRYLLEGELYDLTTNENITETARAASRVGLLGGVGSDDMIVFSPPSGEVKHRITVFTDIDCGYCRQFHRDIAEVNALGIEVHYLFYPRTGPDTESWTKADRVWCAEDRNAALTRAKLGGSVPDLNCADTPVSEHYDLGRQVGVRGTPAIFSESGELLGGYLPPATLAMRLEEAAP